MPAIILFSVLISLQIGDWFSTRLAIANGAHEANPVMIWAIARLGFSKAFIVKGVLVAGAGGVLLCFGQMGMVGLAALVALYVWAVIHNLRVAGKL